MPELTQQQLQMTQEEMMGGAAGQAAYTARIAALRAGTTPTTPSTPTIPTMPTAPTVPTVTTPTPTPTSGNYLAPKGTIMRHIDGSTSVADGSTQYNMSKWSVVSGGVTPTPTIPTVPTTPTAPTIPTTPITPATPTVDTRQYIQDPNNPYASIPNPNYGKATTPTPTAGQDYVIKSGDTLSAIAAKNNTTVAALMAANPQITDPNKIYAGATLKIPGVTAPVTPTAPTAPTVPVAPVTPTIPTLGMSDTQITEAVKSLATAGVDWKTISTYLDAISKPTKTREEITTEMYTKYGITDVEAKMKARPEETFEDIYKRVLTGLNYEDLKAKSDKIIADIDKADADYATATGYINENPWISEAGRVGKIRKLTDDYEKTRARLDNQRILLENQITRAKAEAEGIATRTLNEFVQEREWTKEELNYYIARAEADIEAELALTAEERERELLRYFPEYVKALPVEEAKAPTMKEWGGRMYQWNGTKWVDVGASKAPTLTPAEINNILYSVGLPYTIVSDKGKLTDSQLAKLQKVGIPPTDAQEIMDEILAGKTLEEIRQWMKSLGVNPKVLDVFMTTLQGEEGIINPYK